MTQRVAPGAQGSHVRNIEYGEMGGAPAPYIVPDGFPTRSHERWDDLTVYENILRDKGGTSIGPFAIRAFPEVPYVIVSPGEGYVDGWFASDETLQTSDLQADETYTIVVGWDPDAVYSSDVHNSREEADRVIADAERFVDDDKPYIRIGRIDTEAGNNGGVQIANLDDFRPIGRPIESVGGMLTTSGTLGSGSIEGVEDESNQIVADVPVSNDLAAGNEVSYQFQICGVPVLRVYAESDGSGGVQNLRPHFEGNAIMEPSSDTTADGMTADPESGAEDGYIEVVIGGSTYQIPIYAE